MEINPLCCDTVPDEMIRGISRERRERLLRYRSDLDRKLGVYAEVLVRCMICARSGLAYEGIEMKPSRTGKPYVTGFPGCEFSISHTKSAVAAAVSDKPVGVDVERIRDIDIGIAKRVFGEKELAWLDSAAEDRNQRFFSLWTKKEALVKYYGTGLTNSIKSLDVTGSFPGERIESFTIGDYIVSICSGDECQESDFARISEPELLEMWRKHTL
jgi:4'-phosphopantetheinyl transferase